QAPAALQRQPHPLDDASPRRTVSGCNHTRVSFPCPRGMTGFSLPELERAEALAERVLHRDVPRRRMLIIVNPYATTVSARLKNLVVYALQSRYEVEAVDTQAKLHATELCREAADEGYEVVVAFGGDGTVNEAANGLIGSDVPLTCLPGGSTNVF